MYGQAGLSTRYQVQPLVENNCVESPAPLVSLLFAYEGLRSQHTIFLRENRVLKKICSLLVTYTFVSVMKLLATKKTIRNQFNTHILIYMCISPHGILYRPKPNACRTSHYHNCNMNTVSVVLYAFYSCYNYINHTARYLTVISSKQAYRCFLPSHHFCNFRGCAFHN